MHGLEITVWLEERSGGELAVDDCALYQALHRMGERKHITAEWGITANNRRSRYHRMTAAGRAHLRAEAAGWTRHAASVGAILERRTV